ncbi:hypothetical protein C0992_009034 [Termitomyces sp. T32_za158]|nr:hypothetical protein C0992_009034 [Termitomyces sp. T32_za158]
MEEHRLFSLASSLADSVVSGRAPTDISRLLSLSIPFDDVVETIYMADKILDDHSSDFSHCSTLGILGTVIAIYRERAMTDKDSSEDLTTRWKVAHELCDLVACNQAFEDCKDGDIYDLDAVWQLIGLSTWIVSLTEKLLKECVISSNLDSSGSKKGNGGDVSVSSPSQLPDGPILLHISHPYFLDTFVMALYHVQRFCTYVKSLDPRGKTAQIARDVTVDLISNYAIDVPALLATLEPIRQEVRSFERKG